jgi:hypothetical protein
MSIATQLNGTTSIEVWRKAKDVADAVPDYEDVLGCVGRPLAEFIEGLIENYVPDDDEREVLVKAVEAAREARENLAVFVSNALESELLIIVDHFEFDIDNTNLDLQSSLEDAFDAGVGAAYDYLVSHTVDFELEGV